ncbi:hypothetical protein B0H19DRAFT_952273 [Mycena capillaripes]|nr:hypothetical protein B0H19DRAFT_952273 [Mycena capillaripes]
MIEWLRCLYNRIRYIVRLDGHYAPEFRSLLGILTRDPGSPHLWNLFMSDFSLAHHLEHIQLNGVPINQIEHADDVMKATSCLSGFQMHLNAFQRDLTPQRIEFGSRMCVGATTFTATVEIIKETSQNTVTGCKVVKKRGFIWREQYKVKAQKASKVANVILGLDRFVGTLPAWDLRTLYMARIDPYLTAGCEICLDIEEKSLKLLVKVQLKFLRRMFGLGARSMEAVLFSETGVWPIRYRRVYLAPKNSCFWIGLDHERPAWSALQESLRLSRNKHIARINDLRIVLSRLYIPVQLDISGPLEVCILLSI